MSIKDFSYLIIFIYNQLISILRVKLDLSDASVSGLSAN